MDLRSGAELNGLADYSANVAAKAAADGIAKVATREWGQHGITVNAVAPFAAGPSMRAYFDATPGLMENILAGLSVKRVGDAELDIGRTVACVVGPDTGYITGCTDMADGGGGFL